MQAFGRTEGSNAALPADSPGLTAFCLVVDAFEFIHCVFRLEFSMTALPRSDRASAQGLPVFDQAGTPNKGF